MMILKTSLLKLIALGLLFANEARALNVFDCLKDLMPLTDRGGYQGRRVNVEGPFNVGEKYIAFPEVINKEVTGFYIYDRTGAWYYDMVEIDMGAVSQVRPIASLIEFREKVYFEMVAQPRGLETVTIPYVPGFSPKVSHLKGAVMLGASVLPVIGAMVSRPERAQAVYQSPELANEDELKGWAYKNTGGRKPASEKDFNLNHRLVKLKNRAVKDADQLWQPLKNELFLRKNWIQTNNLDDVTFRALSRAMQTSCKE
jgi:hypothetical protein